MRRKNIILLSVAGLFSSCGSMTGVQNPKYIKPGMTSAYVMNTYGEPYARRFNENVEQWEYRRMSLTRPVVYLVDFVDNKVVAMDMFDDSSQFNEPNKDRYDVEGRPAPLPGGNIIVVGGDKGVTVSEQSLRSVINLIDKESFSDDKLKVLGGMLKHSKYGFTALQTARILKAFRWDDDRLKALGMLAPCICDMAGAEKILETFTSLISRDEAKKLLF